MTNVAVAELPLEAVSFSRQLNSAGTFSGEILISDTTEAIEKIVFNTRPGKTALYVERADADNGIAPALVWGGIIWQRDYDSQSQKIRLTAREFESYFERLFVHPSSLTGNAANNSVTFNAVDQLLIAEALILTAQSGNSLANIGVQVIGAASNPLQPITRTYYEYERKTVFQAVQDLSQADNGFDFNVSVYYDATGTPRKLLNLAYPQLGKRYSTQSTTAPVFQLPGNIVSYTYAEDSATQTNTAFTLGAGSNEAQIYGLSFGTSTQDANYPASWPALESSFSFTDYSDINLLNQLANGRIAAFDYPVTTLNVNATATQAPFIGSFDVADDVRVIINDDRFLTALDRIYRLTAITITPGETNAAELITLSLTLPTNVY